MGVGSNSLSDESATDVALGVKATLDCDDVDGGGGLESKVGLAGYDGGPAMVKVDTRDQCRFSIGMGRGRSQNFVTVCPKLKEESKAYSFILH
jgi:hypothetical protein